MAAVTALHMARVRDNAKRAGRLQNGHTGAQTSTRHLMHNACVQLRLKTTSAARTWRPWANFPSAYIYRLRTR
eukprot:185220-Alexandrium_andersonii.AAC.1